MTDTNRPIALGDTVAGPGYATGCERVGTVIATYPRSLVIRDAETGHPTRIDQDGTRRIDVRPLVEVLREHVAAMTSARA